MGKNVEDRVVVDIEKGITTIMTKNPEKYYGKWIACPSWEGGKILGYGHADEAYKAARKKGVKMPVLQFILDPNIAHFYNAA